MRKLLLVLAVALLVWAAMVVPVPLATLEAVQALPVSVIVEMEGLDHEIPDAVHSTAVRLERPTTVGAVRALLEEHRELTLMQAVAPPGVDEEQFVEFQQRLFRESIRVAVAMGLDAAGLEVTVSGEGARVVATVPGGPAEGALQQEDVITEVDGRSVALASELATVVSEGEPGQQVSLTVRREGEERTETVRLAPLGVASQPGQIGIGVLAATVDLQIDAPVEAEPTEHARIGGPSAGLMLALGTFAAASGQELADGRAIAGSGTIDLSGDVGPVVGIVAKVRGAEQAGAEVFVLPEALADEARQVAADGLDVIPVGSLQDAIDELT